MFSPVESQKSLKMRTHLLKKKKIWCNCDQEKKAIKKLIMHQTTIKWEIKHIFSVLHITVNKIFLEIILTHIMARNKNKGKNKFKKS